MIKEFDFEDDYMNEEDKNFKKMEECIANGWFVINVDWGLSYFWDENIESWIFKNTQGEWHWHGDDYSSTLAFENDKSAALFALRWI